METANGNAGIFDAVEAYLASWSEERVANLQKVDGGWGPFDDNLRPLRVTSAPEVYCLRDAICGQCKALTDARMMPTPELIELAAFFQATSKLLEDRGVVQQRQSRVGTRAPSTPTHHKAVVGW